MTLTLQIEFAKIVCRKCTKLFPLTNVLQCVTVGNKQYKGAFLPLSCLGEEEIRLLCKAVSFLFFCLALHNVAFFSLEEKPCRDISIFC